MIDFLINNGIPKDTITYILMLPIAATLVVVSRQIIGIKGLGISAPLLLGYAFGAIGLKLGLLILCAVLVAGYVIRLFLNNIRLLYLPKTALIITGAALTIILSAPLLPIDRSLDFSNSLFAIIIIIISLEQFYALLAERGTKKIVGIIFETIILAMITFFAIEWAWLQRMVLSYPFIVMASMIAVNLFLGRWTGLRLSEYIRFKDIIFK